MELANCRLCGGEAVEVVTVEPLVYCSDEDCRLNHGDGFSVEEWQKLNSDTDRYAKLAAENARLRNIMFDAAKEMKEVEDYRQDPLAECARCRGEMKFETLDKLKKAAEEGDENV